ncbi:MAG: 50S ribosomal protein L25, partial [Deltaproteobacteria bacterium]
GNVPAILYGAKTENVMLSINSVALRKMLVAKKERTLIQLHIESGEKVDKRVSIIKEMQVNPLTRSFVHVDFFEIDMAVEGTFEVAIHFIGVPMGIDKGGTLEPIRDKIRVLCLPKDLPNAVELDISSMDVGDSLKIGDVKFAKGVKAADASDIALISVHAPRATKEEAVASVASAQPEVLKQKSAKEEEKK